MSLISKRAFAPTRDQPRVINHLVHSHRQSIGLALNDTAQRVADQQHFDPRLVEDPRKRVIVGRETGNLLAALLHFKDMRYGDLVAHDDPQNKKSLPDQTGRPTRAGRAASLSPKNRLLASVSVQITWIQAVYSAAFPNPCC